MGKKVNPLVKIVKIPHGVNLEKFNPTIKSVELDLERPRFVTAANLVPISVLKRRLGLLPNLKKAVYWFLATDRWKKKLMN